MILAFTEAELHRFLLWRSAWNTLYTQIHQVWFGNMITSSWKGFECCVTASFQALWLSLSCLGYILSYHTKISQKFKVKEKEAVIHLCPKKLGIWIINKSHSNWHHFLTNRATDSCLCLFLTIFHPLQESSIMVKQHNNQVCKFIIIS